MVGIEQMIFQNILILYACIVMYMLLDVKFNRLCAKRRITGVVFFSVFLLFNIMAQVLLSNQLYGRFYILLTQLPVYLLFLILSEYSSIKVLFILLTTVFFSAPVIVLRIFVRYTVDSLLVISLLSFLCFLLVILLLYRFFKKPFNNMLALGENSVFVLFTMIPLLYYVYSYFLTKYQFMDRVPNQGYFIQQIPFFIVLVSYFLLVQIFKIVFEKAELMNTYNLVSLQLNAAEEQIEHLRIEEKNFAIYRHDLRHHLNYLNACISENKLQEAAAYIRQTREDIDNMTTEQYSVNEPVNLILSAYVCRAQKKEIDIEVQSSAVNFERFQIPDLCTMLANALENAINACQELSDIDKRFIKLRMYEKSSKLCIDIRNSYAHEPVFEKEVPVSHESGHGIGVKSIVYVAEKYHGVCGFSVKDGVFIFQVSM